VILDELLHPVIVRGEPLERRPADPQERHVGKFACRVDERLHSLAGLYLAHADDDEHVIGNAELGPQPLARQVAPAELLQVDPVRNVEDVLLHAHLAQFLLHVRRDGDDRLRQAVEEAEVHLGERLP
jgi:hypothetical protein